MAQAIHCFSFLYMVLFMSFALHHPSPCFIARASELVINKACLEARNPKFCVDVLSADPRGLSADAEGRVSVSVNLALINIPDVRGDIGILETEPSSPEMKNALSLCWLRYDLSANALNKAASALESHDFAFVQLIGNSVGNNSLDCEGFFHAPHQLISPLTWLNDMSANFGSMVYATAHYITG